MSNRSLLNRGVDSNVELGMRLHQWFQKNDALPTKELVGRLRIAFDCCRATAYRYVRAYQRAKGNSP